MKKSNLYIMKTGIVKLSIIIFMISWALVAKAHKHNKKTTPKEGPKRTQSMIVVDGFSGRILKQENSTTKIYPASLTKLMTLYIAFEELKHGRLSLDEKLVISKKAENVSPSKLGLIAGKKISVKDAILGSIVKSANDATITLAENIAGSEENFAKRMNVCARKLGMRSTYFMNSHGLHHQEQKTTALDLARLALAIKRDFPEYYKWFNRDSFYYDGKIVMGHNKVTREYEGAEGMKTGYTNPAGFNLVTTASKNGKNIVAVLTGCPSAKNRDQKMMSLLDHHFEDGIKGKFSSQRKGVKNSDISNKELAQAVNQETKDIFDDGVWREVPKLSNIKSGKPKLVASKKFALSTKKYKKVGTKTYSKANKELRKLSSL
ncbi:MAG: D-alanyl-D-alanine carboxypeptidase family protein [Rickettsiaceae bacterium]|nr:D-alanyl-D-alanine carboxypeptidase family protein [Rickettsiaceae bacterium]